ncbi:helix-turn-helix transcriptional regulator [uncultured Roseobacter sp.]|uniref:ArsR/SmtB family transcription factor n=1 Tax=uncultured Roseobacter sp. TaxID=114847 RepID=UPI0026114309|nr:helix-turn-helix transcriptional regulator [uncultured Roseobacter sp.]
MRDEIEPSAIVLRALSTPRRLTIVRWLADPTNHFPPKRDGDLVKDGVCVGFITKKINLSQPAVIEHMQVLAAANLVTSKKIKNWVFYKSDATKIVEVLGELSKNLLDAELSDMPKR